MYLASDSCAKYSSFQAFCCLGAKGEVTEKLMRNLEGYVERLYGEKNCLEVAKHKEIFSGKPSRVKRKLSCSPFHHAKCLSYFLSNKQSTCALFGGKC